MATSAEDKQMEELMNKFCDENNVEDASDDDSGADTDDLDEPLSYDDMLEKYRRSVNVTNNALDHIVLATSDLDAAMDNFEEMTGVRPLMVVSHNGLGTKSARVAFEQCAFLEILAPDPKQGAGMPLRQKLEKLPSGGKMYPMHYAIRNTKSKELKNSTWSDLGYGCDQVTMIAKDRGMPWKWDMYFLEDHDDDGLCPFYVNWNDGTHAAARLPIVGKLLDVKVRVPADNKLHQLLNDVDGITVNTGDDLFEFTFTSKKGGKHTYSGSSLIGISFPK